MLWVVKLALLVYVGFGALLYVAQRGLMYLPVAENLADDVPHERIAVDGAILKVWVVDPGNEHAVIYFGGNAQDVYANADEFRALLPQTTVYLVNYRGYGGSTGEPGEQAFYKDALHIHDAVRPRHEGVDVIGRSLGSAVATWLAAERGIDRLVLVTPFDSLAGIAEEAFPLYPAGLLLRERYASAERAPRIDAQTLILVAGDDRIVPAASSRRLVEAFAPGSARVATIAGAGHNSLSEKDEYYRQLSDFLAR